MAAVSIIVTTYNVESYIEQCLNSVAAQTLVDIEVLVVDDGSTDSTPERITEFAARDPRFIPVLLSENSPGGVATAANAGLERATSDWIGFIDGDDYAEPTMFAALHAAATAHDVDLAMCQYREVSDDGSESRPPADAYRWKGLEAGPYLLDTETRKRFLRFIAVPWRKLYRRSLLEDNQISFPVGDYFYEDNPFHWFSILSARSLALVPRVLCYHRVGRAGQTMATADLRLFKIFQHHDTIRAWLIQHGQVDEFQVTLLEWVISQAEWISQRTPPHLRQELYSTLRPIFEQYSPALVAHALQEGRKGNFAHQLSGALVKGSPSRFIRVLQGRPDTNSLLRIGVYHLRYSGVKQTMSMTSETLRNRFGTSPIGKLTARKGAPTGGATTPSQGDVMFGLMVLQQRIDRIESKLDRLYNLAVGESSIPSHAAPVVSPEPAGPQ